jgi:hypothetical protein
MKDLKQKDYNSVLLETSDFFKSQGINIIGEGYKEIATNQQLFESYVESLLEGVGADNQEVLGQLMANTNAGILRESSLSGIAPIASLSMPVIRKLWPKFALKEALKTEVAKTPRFVVSYMKPYMFKGDTRVSLPRQLTTGGVLGDAGRKTYLGTNKVKTADNLTAAFLHQGYTITSGTTTTSFDGLILNTPNTVWFDTRVNTTSTITKQPLDSEFRVASAALVTIVDSEVDSVVDLKIPTHKLDVTNSLFLDLARADNGASVGQLLVRVDLVKGSAFVAPIGIAGLSAQPSTGPTTGTHLVVTLKAGVSSEFNEDSWSVGFDVGRMDIDIPSGQHINAPLPIEALNDMMALYQIDGTKETVDLMTNVFAQKLDLEVLEFLETSFSNQPGVGEFSDYPNDSEYSLAFDVRPAAGFAGSPKAWREELKPQIDYLAQKIKNQTYFQSGIFTIVGNPLDIQLLTNIDWQFRGGQGAGMDGVDVDYSVGTYVGANAYRVIASVNVTQGQIYLVFTPNSDTQMTYKYFPYTFSTEMGYIDPNRSRVPSIMMTKRHSFAEFLPAIGSIIINNNTGTGQFTNGYWPSDRNNDGVAG